MKLPNKEKQMAKEGAKDVEYDMGVYVFNKQVQHFIVKLQQRKHHMH